ncbi:MAG: UDP-N-acetylglucosamine 2-epimerase (non-hydrolyzing) [Winogradskyella sp.]|uniref:non-hydrolyzing UDP-N-acetylglucosamine 2-epimerase n=1 Tax=Winogradskyella sp. TaxID=1883156 RepID=UPI0025E6D80F|nr:UDP-N-acetylglucosamine 2-epimerase (non-hydrolyzing) [Winogradskyella sp.]NRB60107.1 UDP-N-acetylglucosamine 2-epimerase (non-hydrolyzing) [Winogradskyella sp.]
MKKNLIVFGTRPEAIKMAPLVKTFEHYTDSFETKVCVTGQHREMLDQVLDFFEIVPDYDLDLMKPNQSLFDLTSRIFSELQNILNDFKPDFTFVHGDTTTAMVAAISAFYAGSKICHIEAGLRTFNLTSPFPEEANRQLVSRVTNYHFAPTDNSKGNLLAENIKSNAVVVTGNTVIDALLIGLKKIERNPSQEVLKMKELFVDRKVILVTGHRRENHGKGILNICKALKNIAIKNEDVIIVYPVHLNPKVQKPVRDFLSDISNIHLIPPLNYPEFIWLMNRSKLIITDSGGVQEEAPSLGKPVLVMRETTERPEAVDAGTVVLVGANAELIEKEANDLLENDDRYERMSKLHNPYGDGRSCEKIIDFIKKL